MNSNEVSSLKIEIKKKQANKKSSMYLNEQCREHAKKADDVITKNLRHFGFSRVYIRSKRKPKIPETSEMEFFRNLANG